MRKDTPTPAEQRDRPPRLPNQEVVGNGVDAEIDNQIKSLENKYPKVLNFAPDNFLGIEAARMYAEIHDLEAQKDKAQKGVEHPRGVVIGSLKEIDQKRNEQVAREKMAVDNLNKQIDEMAAEMTLYGTAAKNLGEIGKDEWADKFFGDREQDAAQELQAAISEANDLKEQGVSGADDIVGMEARVTDMKQSERRILKAQERLRKASDQREYLDLMGKKGKSS